MTHTPRQHDKERPSASDEKTGCADEAGSKPPVCLAAAARRALAEAEERRRLADAGQMEPPREIGGRGGRDPVRYGDWEIKGRAIDF